MVKMRKATYQEEKQDEAALAEAGELAFHAFIAAMRDEEVILRISDATHVPVDVLRKLTKEEMQQFFSNVDTDMSGTIDFNEWMSALIQMRESTLVEEKEVARAEAAAEQADLQTAVDKVAAAFAE